MTKRIAFFMTREDLLDWLQRVEERMHLRFAAVGSHDGTVEVFEVATLPDQFGVSESGDVIRSTQYLVVRQPTEIKIRSLAKPSGGSKSLVYPDTNPGSVLLNPGGVFQDTALIIGELATALKDAESKELFNQLAQLLKENARSVDSVLVGKGALSKAAAGFRLCERISAPTTNDLTTE